MDCTAPYCDATQRNGTQRKVASCHGVPRRASLVASQVAALFATVAASPHAFRNKELRDVFAVLLPRVVDREHTEALIERHLSSEQTRELQARRRRDREGGAVTLHAHPA